MVGDPPAVGRGAGVFRTSHVPFVHHRRCGVGRRSWAPAVPVRRTELYRHAPVRHPAAVVLADAVARPRVRGTAEMAYRRVRGGQRAHGFGHAHHPRFSGGVDCHDRGGNAVA